MKIRLCAGLAALLALSACNSPPAAGGLSAEEERQLDNAAAMLDETNVFDVSPDSLVANEAEISAEENAVVAAPAAPVNRSGNAQ